MEPIDPKVRADLLRKPGITKNIIDEYQSLQSGIFRYDPDLPMSPDQKAEAHFRDNRLNELHKMLFNI